MKLDASNLWQEVLEDLSENISKPNYDTWLKDTIGISFQGSTLIIGTRSEFVNEWLERRLKPLILKLVAKRADEPLDIEFKTVSIQKEDKNEKVFALQPQYEKTTEHNLKEEKQQHNTKNLCGMMSGNTEFRPTFFRSVAPIKVGRNRLILANFLKP